MNAETFGAHFEAHKCWSHPLLVLEYMCVPNSFPTGVSAGGMHPMGVNGKLVSGTILEPVGWRFQM